MHGHPPRHSSYDAVIVGARVAGAATALLLARHGLRVLVLERGRYGTDTLSTHALMRGGVLQLHRWGVLNAITAAGTPPIRETSFHYADEVVTIPIKPRDGVDALYAPRRDVLDAILVDAAGAAGAEVVHNARLVDVLHGRGRAVAGAVIETRAGRHDIAARVVIGADGATSTLATLVGAGMYRQARHASGVIYAYWTGAPVDGYHWYYRPGLSAGAIPTNDGRTCIFTAMPSSRFLEEVRFDLAGSYARGLAEVAPDLAAALEGAEPVGSYRGFPGRPSFLRQSWGNGWALVGDAGYFKDPITAHGITDALRDAELVAGAVADGSDEALAAYQATRDALSTGLLETTDAIAGYDWTLSDVQALHRRLSEEMAREVAHLLLMRDAEPVLAG